MAGMRQVVMANLHVTLHFLGSVDASRLDEVRALASRLPPDRLSIPVRELTGFPKPARARVLVARLDDAEEHLLAWQAELAERWPTGETRRFDPHVTVARSRQPVRLPELPAISGLALDLELEQADRVLNSAQCDKSIDVGEHRARAVDGVVHLLAQSDRDFTGICK